MESSAQNSTFSSGLAQLPKVPLAHLPGLARRMKEAAADAQREVAWGVAPALELLPRRAPLSAARGIASTQAATVTRGTDRSE